MVRFSDLLGGGDKPEDGRATEDPTLDELAALDVERDADVQDDADVPDDADVEPVSAIESPQDVLERLTQYATSARAGDQESFKATDEPAPVDEPSAVDRPADVDDLTPIADDLLPNPKGASGKPRRSRKRRP